MSDVRVRAGVVAVTAGALLALPVVAEGQVPVVDEVVSGVSGTLQSVTQPAPAAPPGAPAAQPPPAPAPPAPRSTSAHSQSGPARSPAVPSHATGTGAGGPPATSSSRGAGASQAGARASSSARKKAETRASASADEDAADAGQDDGGSARSSGDGVTDVGGDPAARLPFTGLELLLVAMAGLAMLAGGALLRHGARHPRL